MQALTIGKVLQRSAQRYPHSEALVFAGRRFTYRQLDERVNRLAGALLARGATKGAVVAMISRNCHQYIELYCACARIGAIMNAVNPRLTAQELQGILQHSEPAVLVVEAACQETVAPVLAAAARAQLIVHEGEPLLPGAQGYEEALAAAPATAPPAAVDSADPVLLLYTIKGDGQPKGALLSHANFVWDAMTYLHHIGISRRDRLLQVMPFHHVAGLHMLTNAALIRGIPIVIAAQWEPASVCALIAAERCTLTVLVPTIIRQLVENPARSAHDLTSLRVILAAAGQYDRALFTELLSCLDLERLVFGYGLTEASPLVTITETTGETLWKENCLGWPVWYVETRIAGSDGQEAPPGAVGELWVRGPNVCLGYYKMPRASAAAIDSAGWLHTGDLVRADADGCLFFAGRLGSVIKTGGENVDAGEVEAAIAAACAEVSEVAVLGRPHPLWGEAVVAFCVLRPGASLTAAAVRARLRNRLASFKIPKEVAFCPDLPRDETGAVDRQRLLAGTPNA